MFSNIRAECRTHSSIFKVCFILNAELNVELTARYSRHMFSNIRAMGSNPFSSAYSKVCFILNADLERRSVSSIFKVYVFENRTHFECRSYGFDIQSCVLF